MQFIKRQLFLIICGVVGLGSVALGVVGIQRMSDVKDKMTEGASLISRFPALSRDPLNRKTIDAEKRRIDTLSQQYEETMEWAKQRNKRPPLIEGLFPDPDRNQRLAFREAYVARLAQLLEMLDAGTPATLQDIKEAEEQIKEEAAAEKAFNLEQRSEAQSGESAENLEKYYPSGLLTDYGAKQSPEARANIAKAHTFRCYASPASLETITAVSDEEKAVVPEVFDMWYAQLTLWVQESVVEALARVNESAAKQLEGTRRKPWVGNMPVKELISVRCSLGYIFDQEGKGAARPGGFDPAYPPESPHTVFTHNTTNDLYEVVQFTIKAVVDPRMIPTIIEEICKDNLHTLLRLAYSDVSSTKEVLESIRVYGSTPAVQVVMDFETVFLGEIYRPLMPDSILGRIGQTRPEPPATE